MSQFSLINQKEYSCPWASQWSANISKRLIKMKVHFPTNFSRNSSLHNPFLLLRNVTTIFNFDHWAHYWNNLFHPVPMWRHNTAQDWADFGMLLMKSKRLMDVSTLWLTSLLISIHPLWRLPGSRLPLSFYCWQLHLSCKLHSSGWGCSFKTLATEQGRPRKSKDWLNRSWNSFSAQTLP